VPLAVDPNADGVDDRDQQAFTERRTNVTPVRPLVIWTEALGEVLGIVGKVLSLQLAAMVAVAGGLTSFGKFARDGVSPDDRRGETDYDPRG
jgi:hypothetical protein